LLEAQLKEIEERIKIRYLPTIKKTQELLDQARSERSKIGLFSSLFSNTQETYEARIADLEATLRSMYDREREELWKEQSGIRASLTEIRSKPYDGAWWEQINVVVIRKTMIVRGERKILANEPVLFCPRDLVEAAIEKLIKKRQDEEDFRDLKARAAMSDMETRKLAESVKRGIAHQIKLLGVCPYCGQTIDSKAAHADHIYPVSKGGRSHARNMIYVCSNCNIKKGDATLNQFIRLTGYDRDAIEERLSRLGKDY
jgi:5-methylcytosine-specific restriction endonuclease McrA